MALLRNATGARRNKETIAVTYYIEYKNGFFIRVLAYLRMQIVVS